MPTMLVTTSRNESCPAVRSSTWLGACHRAGSVLRPGTIVWERGCPCGVTGGRFFDRGRRSRSAACRCRCRRAAARDRRAARRPSGVAESTSSGFQYIRSPGEAPCSDRGMHLADERIDRVDGAGADRDAGLHSAAGSSRIRNSSAAHSSLIGRVSGTGLSWVARLAQLLPRLPANDALAPPADAPPAAPPPAWCRPGIAGPLPPPAEPAVVPAPPAPPAPPPGDELPDVAPPPGPPAEEATSAPAAADPSPEPDRSPPAARPDPGVAEPPDAVSPPPARPVSPPVAESPPVAVSPPAAAPPLVPMPPFVALPPLAPVPPPLPE